MATRKKDAGAPLRLPVDALKGSPRNKRQISKEALAGLGVSMETFGDLSGLVFNETTGELVCGHQRMTTLRAAGATEWTRDGDEAWIEHPTTGERFPIRIVAWDETKHRMAMLVANNPEIQGEFSEDAIDELRALEMEAGYDELRLNDLADQLAEELEDALDDTEAKDGNTDPDDCPEPPADPISKTGDLWILGEHRLLCGDSTKAEDVERVLGGAKARLMATDPPYGVDYVAIKSSIPGMSAIGRFDDIANDDLKDENLGAFLDAMLGANLPGVADDGAFYFWHPSGELNHVFRTSIVKAGILVHRQIIWVKPAFVLTRSGMYHWQHEPCFYGWRQGNQPPWYGEKNQSSVWTLGRDDGKAVHPTQKPVAIFEIPMRNHTRPGDVCLEPFSGSGSQIIAGERLGRRVCAIEMSPRYVDAAVARWEAYTGKKAHRAE